MARRLLPRLMPGAVTVEPVVAIAGRIAIPPDKSIAHRAAILAALSEGKNKIVGYPDAADPQTTLSVLRALGVKTEMCDDVLVVQGVGKRGFQKPRAALDCGNSGTTMRLMAGVLAGQKFDATLIGDASLTTRPMERVAEPLRLMGAMVELVDGQPPVRIRGCDLDGITYTLPVASAQVKSCVLLAGLLASGTTTVIETAPTRDHLERMLGLSSLDLGGEHRVSVDAEVQLLARDWIIPRDFSAAAFFLAAGSIVSNATLELNQVGLNPLRSGALDVLRAMGARIDITNERTRAYEPIGDLRVMPPGQGLHGVEVDGHLIPRLVDEIPVIAVAAAFATGVTTINGAGELRNKESDRLSATASFLRAMGAAVEELPDGLVIAGGKTLRGATIDSRGDHRIAMAAGVAALAASGKTTIQNADCVGISFPSFWKELDGMAGGGIVEWDYGER